MIGFLRGVLVAKAAPSLLLDVHGVGYEVEAPMPTFYDLPAVGEEVMLHTHLAVREDAHILFGFSTETDRALFRSLIKVNGVGAKLALTILSGVSVEEFCRCVHEHDTAALVRLPGVGKKTAERLIIEMRDRLPQNPQSVSSAGETIFGGESSPPQDALSALVALGYKPQDAARMIKGVSSEGLSSEEIIRLALQSAARS
ncbi:MAG: Holliday junction branch migration protein RuvA [Pseudomonadota bacterium]